MKSTGGDTTITPSDFGVEAKCELDTRADTICAGINCRPIYFTGLTCEAHGFHDDLSPITDVPIATVATLWSDPTSGTSYILIFNEALYFGKGMDHSLINPNQVRNYGVQVHDNPYETDLDRSMGFVLDDVLIPFRSVGSTVYFLSRFPTDEELEMYPHVILSSDHGWDPHNLIMPGGDNEPNFTDDDHFVQQVQSNSTRSSRRDHNIYESDMVMHSVTGNTEQLLYERMIRIVRTSHELHSSTRHSKHTPEHVSWATPTG
jgi:hypothetical protein